jgi:hypothetical protein
MDSETRFYVVLGFIILMAIIIGYLAITNYTPPVTVKQPFTHGFR